MLLNSAMLNYLNNGLKKTEKKFFYLEIYFLGARLGPSYLRMMRQVFYHCATVAGHSYWHIVVVNTYFQLRKEPRQVLQVHYCYS
jgi:hypothetical protein